MSPSGQHYRQRLSHGRPYREYLHPATCDCGRIRYLPLNKIKGQECFFCAQRRKAKKGFLAMQESLRARYGDVKGSELSVLVVRDYLLKRVPASERRFAALVGETSYRNNVILPDTERRWIADFVIGDCVIELNGGIHVMQQERDSKKYVDILLHGYSLAVLEDEDIVIERLWALWMR